jgi:Arc/MetJ-type ribon-helix-helix transcriptional regulator
VQVDLPGPTARALEEQVKAGRFASLEDAVLAGARLVAGLGPRALELLEEGAGADGLVGPSREGREGKWME